MSADSPRRTGVHKGAQVVSPQPISDKSIIDSMAGIINDIVPQGYISSAPNSDVKETITWAKFEYADVNDPALFPDDNEGTSTPPLLLVLGYNTGVQIWLVAASGDATEVLSWRQGPVRTLRVLPDPKPQYWDPAEDQFKLKRPMVAICDSTGPGPQFCSVSFVSLKTAEQVKSIKFKSQVCDVLANKRSIVVTFPEKIAVFDAKTLEDVVTITTCYLSPGPNPNPVALGTRWLVYSEKRLILSRRSYGGCEGEGASSYTATVLHAAKSLGKGLRGLGETVASSLTGNSMTPVPNLANSNSTETTQPGIITVFDLQDAKEEKEKGDGSVETFVAHFPAHSDAIVAIAIDSTGALVMTADRRGHDFHVFRLHPHPIGSNLAAVHHLYILHRGDTTAKVQDMTFSSDSRWAAVSTVRGTTHVFPVAPYGGPVGVRTHSSPHVVNRLSRFHKSAGLTDEATRSHSPSHGEQPMPVFPFANPRVGPYPQPSTINPLAQIRQSSTVNQAISQAQPRAQPRQRLHSDDSISLTLKLCACFAPPRAWVYTQQRDAKLSKRAVDSLYIMACHTGYMIQYDLEPKPAATVPKEKVCDETAIDLEVEAKGQWPLMRLPGSSDIIPPLPPNSPLLGTPVAPASNEQQDVTNENDWVSQVEMFTHAGPHRRLWMGPQFVFKTYNAPSGVPANMVEAETVEVGVTSGSRPARSNPVNMPHTTGRPLMPVIIDGSGSSYEQSPRFVGAYGDALDHEQVGSTTGSGENQLKEDLAEAMLDMSISTPHRAAGRRSLVERVGHPVAKVVNPLGTVITVSAEEECAVVDQPEDSNEVGEESASAPSPSMSICAEEGKWPLEDDASACLQRCVELRDHTQICAEMRRANEPAVIDSVPDDNIEELKERRSLCAEAASTFACSAVDLDRADAFKDMPSSASVCAERGAVPDCSNIKTPTSSSCRLKRVLISLDQQQPSKETKSQTGAQELGYQVVESETTTKAKELTVPSKKFNACPSSDDDIEHINKEELSAIVSPPKKSLCTVVSSDDDIKHVLHCDVPKAEKWGSSGGNGKKRGGKDKQRPDAAELPPVIPPPVVTTPLESIKETKYLKEVEKPVEVKQEQETQQQQQQPPSSYSKKSRVRSKRQPLVALSSSNDMVEIINMDAVVIPQVVELLPPPYPPPSPPVSPPAETLDEPLALPDMVEIIDIDAEKSSGSFPNSPVPDCKILLQRRELSKKKSKRHKKQQSQLQPPPPQLLDETEQVEVLCELPVDKQSPEKEIEEVVAQTTVSWTSIVRRRSGSSPKVEEVEPKLPSEDEEEVNKENLEVTSKENLEMIKREIEEEEEEHRRSISPVEEEEHRRLISPVKEDCKKVEEPIGEVVASRILEEDSEKKSDSEQEAAGALVERSSSSDDLNANVVVPMDTEEDRGTIRSQLLALVEKNASSATMVQAAAALPGKKANRSKKKKRR